MAGSIRKRPGKGSDAFELRVFVGRAAPFGPATTLTDAIVAWQQNG